LPHFSDGKTNLENFGKKKRIKERKKGRAEGQRK
jgi:hypothetical protein